IDVDQCNQRVNTAPRRVEMLRRKPAGRLLYHAGRIVGRVMPRPLSEPFRQAFEAPAYMLSAHERRVLADHFADDIARLARLLSWDLRDWLQEAEPEIYALRRRSEDGARSESARRRAA